MILCLSFTKIFFSIANVANPLNFFYDIVNLKYDFISFNFE